MEQISNLDTLNQKEGGRRSKGELDDLNILHNDQVRDFSKPEPFPGPQEPEDEWFKLPEHEHAGDPVAIEEPDEPEPMTIEELEEGKGPASAKKEKKDHGRHIPSRSAGKPTPEGMRLFQDMQVLKDMYARIKGMEDGEEKDRAMDKFDQVAGFETGIKDSGEVNLKRIEAVRLGSVEGPIFQGEEGVVQFQPEEGPSHKDAVDEKIDMYEVGELANQEQQAQEEAEKRREQELAEKKKQEIMAQENERWQKEREEKMAKAKRQEEAQKRYDDERHDLGVKKRRNIMVGDLKREKFEAERDASAQRAEEIEKMKKKRQERAEENKKAEEARDENRKIDELRERIKGSYPQSQENKRKENEMIGQGLKEASESQDEASKRPEADAGEKETSSDNVIGKINELRVKLKEMEAASKKYGGTKAEEIEKEIINKENKIRELESEKIKEDKKKRIEQKARNRQLKKAYLKDPQKAKKMAQRGSVEEHVVLSNRINVMRAILPRIKDAKTDEERDQHIRKFNEVAGFDTGIQNSWRDFSSKDLNSATFTGLVKEHKEVPKGSSEIPKKPEAKKQEEEKTPSKPPRNLDLYKEGDELRVYVDSLKAEEITDTGHKRLVDDIEAGKVDKTSDLSRVGIAEARALAKNLPENGLDLQNVKDISRDGLLILLNVYSGGKGKRIVLTGLETVDGAKELDERALEALKDFPIDRVFLSDSIKKQLDKYREATVMFEKEESDVEPLSIAA